MQNLHISKFLQPVIILFAGAAALAGIFFLRGMAPTLQNTETQNSPIETNINNPAPLAPAPAAPSPIASAPTPSSLPTRSTPAVSAIPISPAIPAIIPAPSVSIPPELPRIYLNTNYPSLSSSRTIRLVKVSCSGVSNCSTSLQTAIDQASLGDEIVIDAGMIIDGPIKLKEKTSGNSNSYIVIRSSNLASLPPPGNRVSPKDAVNMPKIVAPSGNNQSALITEGRSSNYRLVGIEFRKKIPNDDANVLVQLGSTLSPCASAKNLFVVCADQSALNNYPSNIILDRVYIHGDPQNNVKRGIGLDSKSSAVIDSYISDIHIMGQDSQAIAAIYGPGPYKIVNNYLEGAAENLLFGGDDPRVNGLVATDLEIRNNYFYKPLSWRCANPACSNTRHWAVKNLLEFKNAARVLIDGNILENNWADGQDGIAVLFNTTNQGGKCIWCAVKDVTFSNNVVRHSGGGISIQGNDWHFPISTGRTERIKIYNNLFDDLDGVKWKDLRTNQNANGYLFFLSSGALEPGPDDIEINHNTAFHSGTVVQADKPNPAGGFFIKPRFTFTNNIIRHNTYGILGSSAGVGDSTIDSYFPGALFTKNILMGGPAKNYSSHPGNFFPADWSDVFVSQISGDYRIKLGGPYKNAGTDKRNLGADINGINLATRKAISGKN